jgi:hypothetical protein
MSEWLLWLSALVTSGFAWVGAFFSGKSTQKAQDTADEATAILSDVQKADKAASAVAGDSTTVRLQRAASKGRLRDIPAYNDKQSGH